MADQVRLSHQTLKVLRVFVEAPKERVSGAEIARSTRLMSGTLYPILARLEAAGWLKSEWENVDPSREGRPRRRLYRITASGQNAAVKAFSEIGIVDGGVKWA